MEKIERKSGFSLVEMLIVLSLVMVLTAVTLTVATHLDTRAKEQFTRNTIGLIDAALQEFEEYGFVYNNIVDYSGFKFPLDCNDFETPDLCALIADAAGAASVVIDPAINHNNEYSGCEAMYFFLNRLTQCRKILDTIDDSLVTDKDKSGNPMVITVDDREFQLKRVIDAWGKTLRYDYYEEFPPNLANMKETKKTFPVVISAGPDKKFNTDDDIRNR